MQDFTKLLVWRKARRVTVIVSRLPRFRSGVAPGLRLQLVESAMGISATIAEGAGRSSRADFARFLTMAIGSANEVEHHLTVARDLRLIDPEHHRFTRGNLVEVRRMLFGLRKSILEADASEREQNRPVQPPRAD